jgi:hypothetical protein
LPDKRPVPPSSGFSHWGVGDCLTCTSTIGGTRYTQESEIKIVLGLIAPRGFNCHILRQGPEQTLVAFGWTDNHLHRFGCGSEYFSHDTEYYLCPFDVEGETGVPEEQVRLGEVLVEIRPIW